MSSAQIYRIVDSGSRGMVVVAARDIKAGELVIKEKEPIMCITQADREHYRNVDPAMEIALAGYDVFKRILTDEHRQKFLTLYGPTTGVVADNLRKFLSKNARIRFGPEETYKGLSTEEIEIMVKVLQVARLNMFGTEGEDYKVYSEITRFAHSCASNCQYSFRGRAIVCYARQSIEAGEELTISYNAPRDMDPIHLRRYKYLEMKDFTCHCPRCDARGDDTRQFDCFDPACEGVMMVCQPINKKKVRGANVPYDGVEYVEPHLLPCTVCHRPAPADYQTEMLVLEQTLLELGPRIAQRFSDIMSVVHANVEPIYQEVLQLQLPVHHAASLPLLRVKWRALHTFNLANRSLYVSKLQDAMLEYIRAIEGIITYPGSNLSDELTLIVAHCTKVCLVPVFPPLPEKELCLKALRMHLLLDGRNTRDAILDEVMLKCHEKLPFARSTEMCAFCEESPLHAALTLSRCGRCKQVVYCSAECQKAHWKLHKKGCKASAGGK